MTTPAPTTTICLWFDRDAEDAARFYADTFPNSAFKSVQSAPADFPGGKEGTPLIVEFTVIGIPCIGINGGPVPFQHNEAFSFRVGTGIRSRPIATGTRSLATGVRPASAAGARTDGASHGRSRRSR